MVFPKDECFCKHQEWWNIEIFIALISKLALYAIATWVRSDDRLTLCPASAEENFAHPHHPHTPTPILLIPGVSGKGFLPPGSEKGREIENHIPVLREGNRN